MREENRRMYAIRGWVQVEEKKKREREREKGDYGLLRVELQKNTWWSFFGVDASYGLYVPSKNIYMHASPCGEKFQVVICEVSRLGGRRPYMYVFIYTYRNVSCTYYYTTHDFGQSKYSGGPRNLQWILIDFKTHSCITHSQPNYPLRRLPLH